MTRETTTASFHPEKKKILKRNKRDAILFGVCAGIADYFDVNPIWIRIFFIFLVVVGGTGILFYLFLAILLPVDTEKRPLPKESRGFWE
jgi:phage shock protein PspC (stress-responsive transcriptional regulator)